MPNRSARPLDAILEEFDFATMGDEVPKDRAPITIWVPKDYKDHYDNLQKSSKKKYGKMLQKLLVVILDKSIGKAG